MNIDARTTLPFRKAFEGAIRSGRKTATSRTARYGWPGETLDTPFGVVVLTDVYRQTLGWVAAHLWREEGCTSAEAFADVWRSIHRGHWDATKIVWVHRFAVLEGPRG